jgi:hypothetical protein
MENLAVYAVIAVVICLSLIPIATFLAFVPLAAWGGIGKLWIGRGGADDEEAKLLLHPQAEPNKQGFYKEDDLNVPFEKQKSA